ncbi:hypothetical protein [Streptomyces sp. NPDC020983]|uniref:DUF6197 family protein n=1 Tax=Streptomyces sp. NPDC020983 TaxID=3365106 RepID=UPI0037A39DEB
MVVMTVDMAVFEELVGAELGAGLADEVEGWLHDPARTAHRLVSVPTAALVAEALGTQSAAPATGSVLPGGLWRVVPDRLLALHPGRRAERADRLRVTVPAHLELTARVLEEWGWAQPGRHNRTISGARCPRGAQYALYRLGYGTEHTLYEGARRIQGTLARRGITAPYWQWNDWATTTPGQVIAVVREAAGVT